MVCCAQVRFLTDVPIEPKADSERGGCPRILSGALELAYRGRRDDLSLRDRRSGPVALLNGETPYPLASIPGSGAAEFTAWATMLPSLLPARLECEGMNRALVRFYAELNDFIPPEKRMRALEFESYTSPSVKDLIEGFGVPHTEVDLVLVNGSSVDFRHRVKDGDRVSVYPMFEAIDISEVVKVRPEPLREPRFVLDTHLGKLAAQLRMLGFDAVWHGDAADAELARRSREERRILLTRDRGLLKRSEVTHGHYVRETDPRRQLIALLRRFDLVRLARPFTRCLRCNAELREAEREAVAERLPPTVGKLHERFQVCPDCGQVYWEGSHYRRMREFVRSVIEEVAGDSREPRLSSGSGRYR